MEVSDAVHMHVRDISQFKLLSPQKMQRLARLMELRRALLGDQQARVSILQEGHVFARLVERAADSDQCEALLTHLKVALDLLVQSNLRLVVKFARAYHKRAGSTILLEDLISEGDEGLIEAAKRFDWRQLNDQGEPIKFSTYARFWIDQRFSRYAAAHRRAIRIPNHIQEHLAEIAKATQRLRHQLNDEPGPEQIAREVTRTRQEKDPQAEPVTASWVVNTLKTNQQIASIHEPVGEDDMTLADVIPDQSASLEEEVADASLKEVIESIMASALDDQERMIIGLRFGWFGGAPMNLDDVGLEFGLTRERIRQIEEWALTKLQAPHRRRQLADYHGEVKTEE